VKVEWSKEDAGTDVFGRVQLDNTTTLMEAKHEPNNAVRSLDYHPYSMFYLAESLASGAHYVDIDAYVEGNTGYIKWAKIIVLRLDDWLTTSGMYDYANTEGEINTNSSWQTIETLTFTPDTGGDYLILGNVEAATGSVGDSVSFRLNYDSASEYIPLKNTEESGETWCTFEAKEYDDYVSWVWGGIVNIPASSKTILMEGISTYYIWARKRRIIAIRLGAMSSSAQYNEVTTVTSYTGNTYQTKATKTWTPSNQVDHLILGGIVVKPDAVNTETWTRCVVQTSPSLDEISEGVIDSKDPSGWADSYPFFSAEIKELTTSSHTISSQYRGNDVGDTVYGKGSFVVIVDIEAPPAVSNGPNERLINRLINGLINDRIN